MKPKEGIDKIGVLLNPLLLSEDKLKDFFDPYKRLTKHRAGQFWVLAIHDTWFNPFFDYQAQIALAIYELIKRGVFNFPDTLLTPYFICKNPQYFILSITALEFYSDCKYENFYLEKDMVKQTIDEAADEECLYQYYDYEQKKLTDTYYSPDKNGTHKSQFIIYHKLRKSKKDNIENHEELEKTQNPIRLEFRIYSNNSKWLHWDNLKGNYFDIFKRYKKYLATIYFTYLQGCFSVKGTETPNFKSIVKLAKKDQLIRYRNKGNKLKQNTSKNNHELNPQKHLTEKQVLERQNQVIEKMELLSKKNDKKDEVAEMSKIAEICGWNIGKDEVLRHKKGKKMK